MATRSWQFFMTPKELSCWLRTLTEELSLTVVQLRRIGILKDWHGTDVVILVPKSAKVSGRFQEFIDDGLLFILGVETP